MLLLTSVLLKLMSESLSFQNLKKFNDRVDRSRDTAGSDSWDAAKKNDVRKIRLCG